MRRPSDRAEPTPPLKWAGGKRWQLPVLRPIWATHRHRRLVEPFCGGLGVAIGLNPDHALLNDANPHLINFYRWVGRGLDVAIPMANDRGLFGRHRDRFNALVADSGAASREAASLFYYLNRTGYNGLCRFNAKGHFNVPFGRYSRIAYARDFRHLKPMFKRWTFTAGDISRIAFRPDDFVYADPPYDVEFTQYSRDRFRWDDQVRTAELLATLDGPVVLVNQATDRIVRLYEQHGYELRFLNGPRRISSSGSREPAREVMATRNL